MARRPNYGFEKRQKEKQKAAKAERKREKRQEKKEAEEAARKLDPDHDPTVAEIDPADLGLDD